MRESADKHILSNLCIGITVSGRYADDKRHRAYCKFTDNFRAADSFTLWRRQEFLFGGAIAQAARGQKSPVGSRGEAR